MKGKLLVPQIFFDADTGAGGGGAGAESATAKGETAESSAEGEKKEDKPDEQTSSGKYTDEDITKLKSDFEKQLHDATAKAAEEALRKAQMKPEEKAEYEQSQRLAELEKREREATEKELRLDTFGLLADKQLDKDFMDYVIGKDRDATVQRIDTFKSLFDKAVQAQVEVRLAGKTPSSGGGSGTTEADTIREQIKSAMGGY